MLDLETMGTVAGCAIVSIGAVEFDMAGTIGAEFYGVINLRSAVAAGLTMDPGTIIWWLQQPEEARKKVIIGGVSIEEVLTSFRSYLNNIGQYTYIWGNGPSFDQAILRAAYEKMGWQAPWRYTNERCVRTACSLRPEVLKMPFEGVKHYPVDDCKHQIKQVVAAIGVNPGWALFST